MYRLILMMDKRGSTMFTSNALKGHRKKRDGTSQAAKWNASLASKIKTKLMNNSSLLKVSLQQNNKALAVALSVEKENSRKLKNERIFLQKEVEKLQLHNILLRQKLNSLNKTLIGIEAYLNENLLTAIEISSPSESSFPLPADPSSPADGQFQSALQSVGPVELPVKLPLIATANQQGGPSVWETPNSCQCTAELAEEAHSDQVKFASPLPSGTNSQELVETDPVEVTVDKSKFFKENQLCTELSCNSAFMTHVKSTQSLGQSEELMKQCGSSVPSSGNVTGRRKHAELHKSKTQPNIKDFDKKCGPWNLSHHDTNSDSNTNGTNLQEGSSDFSHIIPSPLKISNESKTDCKKLLFADKSKPEETLYDADMELTASDAGELLTVTAKDNYKLHQNKISNAKSDKKLANFRKVKYSKKNKEKKKSKTEVCSDLQAEERHCRADSRETSQTSDLDIQLFQSQREQLPTGNSEQKQSKTSKDTGRIYQVNVVSPRKQETNEETFSEMSGDMENKIQKANSNSPVTKIPLKVYCAENLPFQDNNSNVLPLQGNSLNTSDRDGRSTINRKTVQNASKTNTAKSCREEKGQGEECISKKSQTEIQQHHSKRKRGQNNITKRKNNSKSSYRQGRESANDSICKRREEGDQKSSHFSPGRLKRALAKASWKACIVPGGNVAQLSACRNEELKNKDSLHAEAGNKVTESQQTQVVTRSGIALNAPSAKEHIGDDASMLKKADSLAVANKKPHISNSSGNLIKQKQRFSSDITETRREKSDFGPNDQGRQNTLDDQEVPHETDSFMSKLKPVIQVECSKNMPLNGDSFSREGLSNVQLKALDEQNASINFSVLKKSEVRGENDCNEALNAEKAERNLDHISTESYKNTLTPCHKGSGQAGEMSQEESQEVQQEEPVSFCCELPEFQLHILTEKCFDITGALSRKKKYKQLMIFKIKINL
ncbi:shugoshin 2 isoform X3 [Willisornis vidua]|uniref:Shugoshin 2 isoform X3 n=1 Tax=Willisornis vidua TaxID=1566151 RepID=A0ABQ9CWM9_9PASS|nr:shugoshin 2 isoform X3 [Willisornis vidua]